MKFIIKHDIRGRLRIHMVQSRMSYEEADTLLYYIENLSGVTSAKVFERTCDASISYKGERETLLQALRIFQYQTTDVPADLLAHSGRELNSTYQEKLMQKVVLRAGSKLFLPYPIQAAYAAFKSVHYIERAQMSGSQKAGSRSSGCNRHRCFRFPRRLYHSKLYYVSVRNRRTSGRVDPQEIRR